MTNALVLYSDRGALGEYRVKFPAQAVSDRSAEFGVRAESTNMLGVDADRVPEGLNVKRVFVPGGIDVISFQRPISAGSADVIAWLRKNRPQLGIVVDVDADMPQPQTDKYLRRAIGMADVVTLSTEAQLEHYPHDNKLVIRDSIPSSYLAYPSRALGRKKSTAEIDADRIIGTSVSSPDFRDLQLLDAALTDVVGADRTGGRRVTFRNIGPGGPEIIGPLGIAQADFEFSGVLPFNLYHVALGEIDLAVVPQSTDRSGLRALEFAAAGVPVIASHTAEHAFLSSNGMPLWLCKHKRREWLRALRAVLSFDDGELKDLARNHRENVRQYHTTERRAVEWADAWKLAQRIAKGS